MADPEIPSYFLCPISLQIMRDPVTLSTGITYDRRSIERWLFDGGNPKTCPATNQPLPDADLTPNHTLRRLIQAWCVANAIERVPTPRPPVDRACIVRILDEAVASPPQSQLASLHKLKSIVSESERSRVCVVETPGAVDFLVSVISTGKAASDAVNEALSILVALRLSEQNITDLVSRNADNLIGSLSKFLYSSNAMLLLKSIISVIAPARLMNIEEEVFVEIVNVLRERISAQTTKAALEALIGLCPWGRNRITAVGVGAVHVLIELLIDADQERRVINEMTLAVLDKLSGCAEGAAEIVSHAAGIAAVSKKILRVSSAGNERAVKILYSVARHSATAAVLQEMEQVGVVSKLCMMLMVDCGIVAKVRAREFLRMHSKVWRRSPCLSPQLQALYPC